MTRRAQAIVAVTVTTLVCALPAASAGAAVVKVGAGSYDTAIHDPAKNKTRNVPTQQLARTGHLGTPFKTNSWTQPILWNQDAKDGCQDTNALPFCQQPVYPLPWTAQYVHSATDQDGHGLRLMGKPELTRVFPKDPDTGEDIRGQMEVHRDAAPWDVTVRPGGLDYQKPTRAEVDREDAFSARFAITDQTKSAYFTLAHGSPYVWLELPEDGQFRFSPRGVTVPAPFQGGPSAPDATSFGVTVNGTHYGIFLPEGGSFDWKDWPPSGVAEWRVGTKLPAARRFAVVAVLPDASAQTFSTFAAHAFAEVTGTESTFAYDGKGAVTQTLTAETTPLQGTETRTIMGLYPHHWRPSVRQEPAALLPYTYASIRGELKTALGNTLTLKYPYSGVLPQLPDFLAESQEGLDKLKGYMDQYITYAGTQKPAYSDIDNTPWDTYFGGKRLGQMAELLPIAEMLAKHTAGDEQKKYEDTAKGLEDAIKGMLERFFTACHNAACDNPTYYFQYDREWRTLTGYTSGFGADTDLNDHHFHSGYWIRAAAQIGLRDPNWAKREQWGGMVEELIGDYANSDPQNDRYPQLRYFDAYEGHGWASGHTRVFSGPNEESSSEEMNAWAAMILWGQATGNQRVRDTGIALYSTASRAIDDYWFDLNKDILDDQYVTDKLGGRFVAQVYGGMYKPATFFGIHPIWEQGINYLPITPASLYLGRDPAYVEQMYTNAYARYDQWPNPNPNDPANARTQWSNIMASYLALANPTRALQVWDDGDTGGAQEGGDSKPHTYNWIRTLQVFGRPNLEVTSDSPLSSTFRDPASGRPTYVAYNTTDAAQVVTFSDGTRIQVQPKSMAVTHGSDPPNPPNPPAPAPGPSAPGPSAPVAPSPPAPGPSAPVAPGPASSPATPSELQPSARPRARIAKLPRAARAGRLKRVSGSASGPGGRVARVELALLRHAGKRCLALRNGRVNRKLRRCKPTGSAYLRAKGTTRWSFQLPRRLPKGRYTLYARATAGDGTTQAKPARTTFRVR